MQIPRTLSRVLGILPLPPSVLCSTRTAEAVLTHLESLIQMQSPPSTAAPVPAYGPAQWEERYVRHSVTQSVGSSPPSLVPSFLTPLLLT